MLEGAKNKDWENWPEKLEGNEEKEKNPFKLSMVVIKKEDKQQVPVLFHQYFLECLRCLQCII
jgi:hypothetical protein